MVKESVAACMHNKDNKKQPKTTQLKSKLRGLDCHQSKVLFSFLIKDIKTQNSFPSGNETKQSKTMVWHNSINYLLVTKLMLFTGDEEEMQNAKKLIDLKTTVQKLNLRMTVKIYKHPCIQ